MTQPTIDGVRKAAKALASTVDTVRSTTLAAVTEATKQAGTAQQATGK